MEGFVIIAGHLDPRVTMFQAALGTANLPQATVVSYEEIAESYDQLVAACSSASHGVLRIDSSGNNLSALQAILTKGANVLNAEQDTSLWTNHQSIERFSQSGRLVPSHQYYAGLHALLNGAKEILSKQAPNTVYMNPIEDSLLMSDKAASHAYLEANRIPVAPALTTALNPIVNYDDLKQRMRQTNTSRVFVKPRYGAGAAGIVALAHSAHSTQALTTIECVNTKEGLSLFNSRKLRHSKSEGAIEQLIDQLCHSTVHVEHWIPKAQVNGRSVDMRMLVIGGEVCHQILRLSRSPITNLHLMNERGDVSLLREKMTKDAWQSVLSTCEKVAALFPNCTYLALDIAVDITLQNHVVLEVNAFGDYIKGALHNGMPPYDYEIQALQVITP